MAIRLRQSTQKDQQASAASFGLGLDQGDGGARAIQGALGQVAGATKQIAGNLERKDEAVQKGNAKRKGTKKQATWDEMIREGETLIDNKEYGLLNDHKEMMKAWAEGSDVNDVQFNTEGDTSIRDEYANPINEFYKNDYGRVAHAFDRSSLAGSLANEAEVALKTSGNQLSEDVSNNRVSWVTGARMSAGLNSYFADPAFAETSALSQEIYKEQGRKQMVGYVDALRSTMARKPNTTAAQAELTTAQEHIRSADWMTVPEKNALIHPLSTQIDAMSKGANVSRAQNALHQHADAAGASGVVSKTLEENLAIVDSALEVTEPGSEEYDDLISRRETATIQDRMMDTDAREEIWAAYEKGPDFVLSELSSMQEFDFDNVKNGNMSQINAMKDSIISVREDAESDMGYMAGAMTMTPRAGDIYASSTWAANTVMDQIHKDGTSDENIKVLQQEARRLKYTVGEYVEGGLPTETKSGKSMVAFLPEAMAAVTKDPSMLGSAAEMLVAGNRGVNDVALWMATTSDTDNPDIDAMKGAVSVALRAPVGMDTTAILNMMAEDPMTQWPDGKSKNLWIEYQAGVRREEIQPVSTDQQMFQQKYGSWSTSMFWAEFGKATLAHSIQENSDMPLEWHLSNAEKPSSSVAQIYTGSHGQDFMLFSRTEKAMSEGSVNISSPLNTFLRDIGNVVFSLDTTKTATVKNAENINRKEVVDLIHLSAHSLVMEAHPDLLENYFSGLSSKAAGDAEMESAIADLRDQYPTSELFKMLRLGAEVHDEASGEFVVPFLLPAYGPKGFKSGWDVVKLDDGSTLSVPVSRLISDVRSAEVGSRLRRSAYRQEVRRLGPRLIQPLKRGARRIYDKTIGAGPVAKGAESVLDSIKEAYE